MFSVILILKTKTTAIEKRDFALSVILLLNNKSVFTKVVFHTECGFLRQIPRPPNQVDQTTKVG